MKIIIVLALLLIFGFCQPQEKYETITESDIRNALQFALDSTICNKMNDYELYSIFEYSLNDSILNSDLVGIDTAFDKENIDFMAFQFNELSGESIKPFIPQTYHSELKDDYSGDKNTVFFSLSPPMFNKNKTTFTLYVLSIFDVNGDSKWDDLYFVFNKKDDGWKLKGLIKRK